MTGDSIHSSAQMESRRPWKETDSGDVAVAIDEKMNLIVLLQLVTESF